MPKSADELELLALVEGELPPEREREVLARLAANPQRFQAIRGMQRDRRVLSSLPEPELPVDLVRMLEPLMARTMLVDDPPMPATSYRRRSTRWGGAAAAGAIAAAMLAISATTWFVLSQRSTPSNRTVVADSRASDPAVTSALPPVTPVEAPVSRKGHRHHYAPLGLEVAAAPSDSTPAPAMYATGKPTAAVVIEAESADYAVSQLASWMSPIADRAAFVENFSYRAAAEYEKRWLARHRESGEAPTLIAGTGEPVRGGLSSTQRLELVERAEEVADAGLGQHLVGATQLTPTPELQLELSEAGCGYAMVIPADQVAEVFFKLASDSSMVSRVRPLASPEPAATVASDSWSQWLSWKHASSSWPVREDGMVVIPIEIRGRIKNR